MNFGRVISGNIFRRLGQLENLTKTNILSNSCKPPVFIRTTTSLPGFNRCLNSTITNGNRTILAKIPKTSTIGLQQLRNESGPAHDHVRLWVLERIVSLAIPITIPVALVLENSLVDMLMSVLVVMHTHWGLGAIIVDYARPKVVGPVLPKVLNVLLILTSALTLAGLFYLSHHGPGVSKSIKDLWAIGKEQKEE